MAGSSVSAELSSVRSATASPAAVTSTVTDDGTRPNIDPVSTYTPGGTPVNRNDPGGSEVVIVFTAPCRAGQGQPGADQAALGRLAVRGRVAEDGAADHPVGPGQGDVQIDRPGPRGQA